MNVLNGYSYPQDWSSVLELLNRSLYAEQIVCSMSTQLFHIPATGNLEGNPEMHEHHESLIITAIKTNGDFS